MKVDIQKLMTEFQEERLKSINRVRILLKMTQCRKCKNIYVREIMWRVPKKCNFSIGSTDTWYYCMHCFTKSEDVLHEVDSDSQSGINSTPWSLSHRVRKKYRQIASLLHEKYGRGPKYPEVWFK